MREKKKIKSSRLIQAISALLLYSFTSTTIAWSAPAIPVSEVRFPSAIEKIEIPEILGTVKERFTGAGSSFVIHIQDAHANYEAQLNTQKILRHLANTLRIDLIFLEGATENVDPRHFAFFSDNDLNREVVDLFTRDGMVGGVELFLFDQYLENNPDPAAAYGVENLDLYRENLQAYRAVLKESAASDNFLNEVKSNLLSQNSKVFNKELKEFFREWLFYQDAPTELMRHLNTLKAHAKSDLSLNLSDIQNQLDWPQLVRFFKLQQIDKEIDAGKTASDRERLIAWCRSVQLSAEWIEGISHLTDLKTFTANQKGEDKSPRAFLEKFYATAQPKGFSFEEYPEFSKKLGTLILQSEMNATSLFQEIRSLTDKILDRLAKTSEEKELITIYQDFLRIKKLFRLELIHDEYDQMVKSSKNLTPSAIVKRLDSTQKTFSESKSAKEILPQLSKLDALFSQALEFYAAAKKREDVMFRNMLSKMQQSGKTNAVLVTGGFHSEGMLEQLRNHQISYVEITPHITQVSDNKAYREIMTLQSDYLTLQSQVRPIQLIMGLSEIDRIGTDDRNLYAALVNSGIGSAVNRVITAKGVPEDEREDFVQQVLADLGEEIGAGLNGLVWGDNGELGYDANQNGSFDGAEWIQNPSRSDEFLGLNPRTAVPYSLTRDAAKNISATRPVDRTDTVTVQETIQPAASMPRWLASLISNAVAPGSGYVTSNPEKRSEARMLVLTRGLFETVAIGDAIEVGIVEIRSQYVQLRILAPELGVRREELPPDPTRTFKGGEGLVPVSRKAGEKVRIGENIIVKVVRMQSGNKVRIGIDAPKEIPIYRRGAPGEEPSQIDFTRYRQRGSRFDSRGRRRSEARVVDNMIKPIEDIVPQTATTTVWKDRDQWLDVNGKIVKVADIKPDRVTVEIIDITAKDETQKRRTRDVEIKKPILLEVGVELALLELNQDERTADKVLAARLQIISEQPVNLAPGPMGIDDISGALVPVMRQQQPVQLEVQGYVYNPVLGKPEVLSGRVVAIVKSAQQSEVAANPEGGIPNPVRELTLSLTDIDRRRTDRRLFRALGRSKGEMPISTLWPRGDFRVLKISEPEPLRSRSEARATRQELLLRREVLQQQLQNLRGRQTILQPQAAQGTTDLLATSPAIHPISAREAAQVELQDIDRRIEITRRLIVRNDQALSRLNPSVQTFNNLAELGAALRERQINAFGLDALISSGVRNAEVIAQLTAADVTPQTVVILNRSRELTIFAVGGRQLGRVQVERRVIDFALQVAQNGEPRVVIAQSVSPFTATPAAATTAQLSILGINPQAEAGEIPVVQIAEPIEVEIPQVSQRITSGIVPIFDTNFELRTVTFNEAGRTEPTVLSIETGERRSEARITPSIPEPLSLVQQVQQSALFATVLINDIQRIAPQQAAEALGDQNILAQLEFPVGAATLRDRLVQNIRNLRQARPSIVIPAAVHSLAEAREAVTAGANVITINAANPDLVRTIAAEVRNIASTPVLVFGRVEGAFTPEQLEQNIREVLATGVNGVQIISPRSVEPSGVIAVLDRILPTLPGPQIFFGLGGNVTEANLAQVLASRAVSFAQVGTVASNVPQLEFEAAGLARIRTSALANRSEARISVAEIFQRFTNLSTVEARAAASRSLLQQFAIPVLPFTELTEQVAGGNIAAAIASLSLLNAALNQPIAIESQLGAEEVLTPLAQLASTAQQIVINALGEIAAVSQAIQQNPPQTGQTASEQENAAIALIRNLNQLTLELRTIVSSLNATLQTEAAQRSQLHQPTGFEERITEVLVPVATASNLAQNALRASLPAIQNRLESLQPGLNAEVRATLLRSEARFQATLPAINRETSLPSAGVRQNTVLIEEFEDALRVALGTRIDIVSIALPPAVTLSLLPRLPQISTSEASEESDRNRAALNEQIEFMRWVLHQVESTSQLKPEQAPITQVPPTGGILVLTTSVAPETQDPIAAWRAKEQVLTNTAIMALEIEGPSATAAQTAPFIYAGDHTREFESSLKNTLLARRSEARPSQVLASAALILASLFAFDRSSSFDAAVLKKQADPQRQRTSTVIPSGTSQELEKLIGRFIVANEPVDYENASLTAEEIAAASYYRTRILREIGSALYKSKISAERLNEEEFRRIVAPVLLSMLPDLDIAQMMQNGNRISLTLATVNNQLQAFRAARQKVQTAA